MRRVRWGGALIASWTLAVGLLPMPVAQAAPAPTVSGFSPACGPVGTSVSISGSHFQQATLVEFNGVDQTTFSVNSSNSITTTVPSGATTGKVKVTTPDGSGESTDDFTVSSLCAPTISSFAPTSGPVGSPVTISGSNLVGATAVRFNVTNASTFSWNPSGTQLTAIVPSGATTGRITVITPAGSATSAQDFTVTGTPAAPTIASFVPITGSVGTSVVITGTNLTGATEVRFKNTSATDFTVDSDTRITAVVPPGAMTGKITVTTPGGSATSVANFTVTPPGSPTITSFSPSSGPAGTTVTIEGTNFTGTTSVRFDGTPAGSFTVVSSSRLTSVVPIGATTGPITVTNANGAGTSATDFTVTASFHGRTITLNLRRHLVAKGTVSAADGFEACFPNVAVRIQRRIFGEWRKVTLTTTDATGFYRERIPDRIGKYRAVARKLVLGSDVCRRARSPVVFNA